MELIIVEHNNHIKVKAEVMIKIKKNRNSSDTEQ